MSERQQLAEAISTAIGKRYNKPVGKVYTRIGEIAAEVAVEWLAENAEAADIGRSGNRDATGTGEGADGLDGTSAPESRCDGTMPGCTGTPHCPVHMPEAALVAAERAGYERGQADQNEADEFAGVLLSQIEAAGYERCKRDTTTSIEAAIAETAEVSDCPTCCGEWRDEFRDLIAVVAALNATQQEASDG